MKLRNLLYGFEHTGTCGLSDIDVNELAYRPEDAKESCAYVLLKGIKNDTKKYLPYILSKAPGVIIHDRDELDTGDIPAVRVKDARAVLAFMYSRLYVPDIEKLRFTGVTGTNGKTTTSRLIYSILRKSGLSCIYFGTGRIEINDTRISPDFYSMTTPDPEVLYPALRRAIDAGCTDVVMEVSSHSLALGKVAPIHFCRAVFTNLSPEHLDFHKNMDAYADAKLRLFNSADTGIFNIDDEYSKMLIKRASCAVIKVGCLEIGDVNIHAPEINGLCGSSYSYVTNNCSFIQKLHLPGAYNIYNSALALCCAISLGIPPRIAKTAVSEVTYIEGRMEKVHAAPDIYIDYAHTPAALEAALRLISASVQKRGRIITVFGCGGERDREKRPIMAAVAEMYSSVVVVTEDNCRNERLTDIFRDILVGFSGSSHKIIANRERAIDYAVATAKENDTVLIAGKGHEEYTIGAGGILPYSEKNAIYKALKLREEGNNKRHEN